MAFYVSPLPIPSVGSGTENVTAYAGGGQAGATQFVSRFNHVATCATNGDSVKLPPYASPVTVWVSNDGASSLAVFPYGVDRIGSALPSTSYSIAPGKAAQFVATGTFGKWLPVHSA